MEAMADPGFWRDLRVQFESLEHPYDSVADFQDGAWSLNRNGSFYSRFRTFAMRGAQATGATGDSAVDAWLNLLRERTPHFRQEASTISLETEVREILLAKIDPPDEDVPAPPGLPNPRLVVEPRDDRFVIIRGQHLYAEHKTLGYSVVECEVKRFRERQGGWIQQLRTASMELCEQLETEAFARERAQPLAGESLEECQPDAENRQLRKEKRQQFVMPLLEEQDWTPTKWATTAGVDPSVPLDYLEGISNPRRTSRHKLASALKIPEPSLPR